MRMLHGNISGPVVWTLRICGVGLMAHMATVFVHGYGYQDLWKFRSMLGWG